MTNLQIAELLRDVAAAYQLRDEEKNKFKIIAYGRAADAVEHASSELKDLWDEGKLEEVPGIGPSIAGHLDELFKTGKSIHFEGVMEGFPPKIFELMKVPGVGPKTALKMIKEGNVPKEVTLELQRMKEKPRRHLLPYASVIASEIINYLERGASVKRIDPLGSLRRQVSTVGDIDISVASDSPSRVLDLFVKYPKKQKVIERGEHTASILLPGDVQVDLMVQDPVSYGSLLQHFTGSKHHNIALREYALKKGMSLSEYGIKRDGKLNKFKDEKSFYKYLGLDYIPPELREDAGEIEAALRHAQGKPDGLPKLIEFNDVKGDLQIHSSFDIETSHDIGESSMEEIVARVKELGYEYIAFTEHNPSRSKHTDEGIINLLKKKQEKVREKDWGIKVFNSLEIDILPDGSLPVPEEGLETLDFALVSIHSSFNLSKADMTRRVITSLAHPKVKIFAHPTTRKINEREGVELNWPEIFEFCRENNKFLEINADPMRLDLPDTLVREAIKAGVKLTLGTDAHHKDGLNNMIWGVSVARRGWATNNDIINTLGLREFEEVIKE